MSTDTQTATWARELSATEDQLNEIATQLDAARKHARQKAKALRERARHLLALISGREGEQLELPTEPAPVPAEEHKRSLYPPVRTGARRTTPAERTLAGHTILSSDERLPLAEAAPAEASEVRGDDQGWAWGKLRGCWHLWHEGSQENWCSGDTKEPDLIAPGKPKPHEHEDVCIECQEAEAPAAVAWRKVRKVPCGARLKSGEPCLSNGRFDGRCALHRDAA